MNSEQQSIQAANQAQQSADRAEAARLRQRKEGDAARGSAQPLPGKPTEPVSRLGGYWGERQKKQLDEFMAILPIAESVASYVPTPEPKFSEEFESLSEEQKQAAQMEAIINSRLSILLKAKNIVSERLRKEL